MLISETKFAEFERFKYKVSDLFRSITNNH